jgi:hypothetical protein
MSIESHKKNEVVPRIGHLWIHIVVISPHHKVRFFFPKINELFAIRNKVIRVEHIGEESKALVWRLVKDSKREWLQGILNMKIRCNMVCNNFLLGISLC